MLLQLCYDSDFQQTPTSRYGTKPGEQVRAFYNLVYFFALHLKRLFINPSCRKSSGLVQFYVCVCVCEVLRIRRTINSPVCIRMQKDHIRTLKILQSTSEFGGLRKLQNNQAFTLKFYSLQMVEAVHYSQVSCPMTLSQELP